MSTWICKAAFIAALVALAGCESDLVARQAPSAIQLSDGLIVAGAAGWCIDTATTRAQNATAVVVLGNCAAIAGNPGLPQPDVSGVVTVSIENPAVAAPLPKDLAAYLATDAGRAALARDGNAESVEILETATSNDALYLHTIDKSQRPPGRRDDYWRALFDIEGRIVTVSLVTGPNQIVTPEIGFQALEAQISRLKSANATQKN